MDIIHITNKGKMMDTLERFYVYEETESNNQNKDKLTVKYNPIFETVVHEDSYREQTDSS
jgi:hypothetical protein